MFLSISLFSTSYNLLENFYLGEVSVFLFQFRMTGSLAVGEDGAQCKTGTGSNGYQVISSMTG